ncbi:MAG: hemolysin family protein [Coriobacteriia bacterium]|nr:hemolysin family protein [Coriobacteriia bacterium]
MIGLVLFLTALVLVVLIVVMAVLSAADAAVRLLSRARTRRLVDAEVVGSVPLDALAERPSRLAAAVSLWRAISFSLAAASVGYTTLRVAEEGLFSHAPLVLLLASAVVAFIVLFVLGETLPRTLAVQNPERVGLAMAPAAARMTSVLAPVARMFAAGWVAVTSLIADEPVRDAWLTGDEFASETTSDAVSEREDAEEAFFEAVVDFGSTIVREVMVPRTDMECLEDTATVADAVSLVRRTGLSRIPIYRETLDDILGVLYAKDLLSCIGDPTCPESVVPFVREAFFVPETKPGDELLMEMRQRKTHIALVADEYGGTAGLVTIEDLIEEIVGEIFDEYDRAEELVVRLDSGVLLLDARLPVDDFNDLLGTAIEIDADSIGGLFVEMAGCIPEPGESIEVEGVRMTVRDMEGNRVRRLLVEPRSDQEKEAEDAESHNRG